MIIYFSTTNPKTFQRQLFPKTKLPTILSSELFQELTQIENFDKKPYLFRVDINENKYSIFDKSEIQLSHKAYFNFIMDLAKTGQIESDTLFEYLDIETFRALLAPSVEADPKQPYIQFQDSLTGAACGKLVTTIKAAEECIKRSEPFIIAIETLTPQILNIIKLADGFVTTKVGSTSHAAVIARGRQIPGLFISTDTKITKTKLIYNNQILNIFEDITIDCNTKRLFAGRLNIHSTNQEILDQFAHCIPKDISNKVFLNSENPKEIEKASHYGVKNIGLLRLEHLVLQTDLLNPFRILYLSDFLNLEELKVKFQQKFSILLTARLKEISDSLRDSFVTIRLLDPPIHEFFDLKQDEIRKIAKTLKTPTKDVVDTIKLMAEKNPMMGNRGARLMLQCDVLLTSQLDAIIEIIKLNTTKVKLEIPFVLNSKEAKLLINKIKAYLEKNAIKPDQYSLGIMFEIPSMLYSIEEILGDIDFVSFGTNDLTQFTLGLSRDDNTKIIDNYIQNNILTNSPFEVIDTDTVGEILKRAVKTIKAFNPKIQISVCGEHGGNYESIKFFKSIGINQVSCSAGRVMEAIFAMSKKD
ncbi:hypothetical protein KBD45_05950 [Candidatus Dojkabacteria bacterium]|nr:hypothetical protein [Candidatus Dojkabacteria bacterium]